MGRGRKWPPCVRAVNTRTGKQLGDRIRVAQSMWARGRGLMFRPGLGPGEGLLIDPCSSIHTMWMRFPIDVVYVDVRDVVVRIHQSMPPWRLGPVFTRARYVIELPPGTIAASGTMPGDTLRFDPRSG